MWNLAAIEAAVFQRLATDAEGAAVRAALGGAGSVLHATTLRTAWADGGTRPGRPLVLFRAFPWSQTQGLEYMVCRWFVEDDTDQRYWRINSLISLIDDAYKARIVSVAGHVIIQAEVTSVGAETEDPGTGLLARFCDVTVVGGRPREQIY